MNNKVCRLILMNVLFLILSSIIFSQNQPKAWYVYKNATGLNNGTSWTNAWTSFSSINWNNISSGDTVFISGGTDSIVYYQILAINKKFSAPPVVVTKGKDPNHNGKVIIDGMSSYGNNVLNENVYFGSNASNIVIDSLFMRAGAGNNVNIYYADSITIQNCNIRVTNGQTCGIRGWVSDYITIHNNYIETDTTGDENGLDGDCIIINQGTGHKITSNNLVLNNTNPVNHSDVIQVYENTSNYEFSGNFVLINNQKSTNSSGVYLRGNGTIKMFNNVVIDRSVNNVNGIFGLTDDYTLDTLLIYNNSIWQAGKQQGIGYRRFTGTATSQPYIEIKNNAVGGGSQTSGFKITGLPAGYPGNGKIKIDNNLVTGSSAPYYYEGTSRNFSYWQNNLGFDLNGYNTMPGYTSTTFGSEDLRPTFGSNLLNVGATISLFNNDILGVTRPQGSAWDIGAYEYLDESVVDNIPPEVVSAAIVDSITLRIIFSEPLEQSNALNPSNYQIDNGVTVNNVEFISNSVIKLNTTIHNPGFYTVTVSNVTDTAGNFITNQNNSANYGYNPDPLPGVLKFTPTGTNASSIPEPDHLPEKTFDGLGYNSGDPTSRWAGDNLPQWIGYDLGNSIMLNKTRIQFYKWNEGRIYNYSIMVSTDSINWSTVKQNVLSTNTEWTEENFEPTPARYVRIVVHSNNQNNWASLWETEFYGHLIVSGYEDDNLKPDNFSLEQNYPNPFNPVTKIRYSIPGDVKTRRGVSLRVFDILGNEVATLVDEYKEPGRYEVEFNASGLSSGVYVYRLQTDGYISTKKMILLR